ncbi:kinase [Rhodococcus sp. X156]|uniref:kinase n=1 Tax=Rhodococcus sp. X156 TaxID=2499145 RepID=UPI000FD92B2C|nr:kinase [Rhodococcus sp. X156]
MRAVATDPVTEVVQAAQRLLTRRTGAPVTLVDPVDLGGSDRTLVLRVRAEENPFSLPKTMVVKRMLEGPLGDSAQSADARGAFLREAVSYQFGNSLRPEHRPGAEMFAHDVDDGLLVLSDLGNGPTLADVLLRGDGSGVQHGLMAWAQALGRMHAATANGEDDFRTLLRRANRQAWPDPMAKVATTALNTLPDLLAAQLGVSTPPTVAARATGAQRLLGQDALRAFSPSDLCPDNAMITDGGVRFLDFEWGGFRDVTLDAAYALVPFPSCWCIHEVGESQAEKLVQAWRSEVVGVWPELADDAVLWPRMLDAQLLWVWLSTYWFLPASPHRANPGGHHPLTYTRQGALRVRWQQLARAAERGGDADVAEHALAVAAALQVTG